MPVRFRPQAFQDRDLRPRSRRSCEIRWAAAGPVVVPISEAAAHIGESLTVEGRVADVFTSKAGNTFLNFGAAYPRQTFSAVIFAQEAALFPGVHGLDGRRVQLSGRITLYEGKPQIILKEASQLRPL